MLALSLLGLSVAANALGHGLAAFSLAPAWWVVVAVSAVAPAVLGAVVHLAVLVGRLVVPVPQDETDETELFDADGLSRLWATAPPAQPDRDRAAELIAEGAGRRRLSRELDISEYEARQLLARTRTDANSGGDDKSTENGRPDWAHAVNGSGRGTP